MDYCDWTRKDLVRNATQMDIDAFESYWQGIVQDKNYDDVFCAVQNTYYIDNQAYVYNLAYVISALLGTYRIGNQDPLMGKA